jgi:hypothetical protein
VTARRGVHQRPLAAIVVFLLGIFTLPQQATAQDTSPAEADSTRPEIAKARAYLAAK